jgi:hypothetical protein
MIITTAAWMEELDGAHSLTPERRPGRDGFGDVHSCPQIFQIWVKFEHVYIWLPGPSWRRSPSVGNNLWRGTRTSLANHEWQLGIISLVVYICMCTAVYIMPGFKKKLNPGWQQVSTTRITSVSNGLRLQSNLENAFIDTSLASVFFIWFGMPYNWSFGQATSAQVAGMHFRFKQKQPISTVLSDKGLVFKDQSPCSSDSEMGDLVTQAAEL